MALGCYINIDSFSEIEMIARMPKKLVKLSTFGVRVNPVIGAGTIGVTSTAASGSKFGIELVHGAKKRLTECY
jgi:diaminopimelate decarboxylase